MRKKEMRSFLVAFALTLLLYFLLAFMMSTGMLNYWYSGLIILACINIVLAVSLNLAAGYLGQLTLGHAGFMAVGAYVSAILTMNYQVPFFVAILIAAVASAIVGLVIGIPTLRIRGDYLCIITLAFNEIIRVILLNLDITRGAKGLRGIPMETDFEVAFLGAVLTIFIIYEIVKSRFGRAIISIKEDETASELSGISVSYYKILAFVISAFFAGIAGGLYAHYMGMLIPGSFDYNKSVEILVMVVLGGLGSLKGSVIAAIVMTFLPELLRSFSDYRMLLYAIALIAVMIIKEKNIIGIIKSKFFPNKSGEVAE